MIINCIRQTKSGSETYIIFYCTAITRNIKYKKISYLPYRIVKIFVYKLKNKYSKGPIYLTFLYCSLSSYLSKIFFASFLVSVLCFFLKLSLFQLSHGDSCRSFSLLKAIAIRLQLLFATAFKSVKER